MKGFIVIPDEFFQLGLPTNSVLLLSLIYTYSQGEQGCYYGSQEVTAARLGIARRSVAYNYEKLLNLGFIEKEVIVLNGQPRISYKWVCRNCATVQKLHKGVCKNVTEDCAKIAQPSNNIDNNIKDNIEIGKRAARPRDLSEVLAYIQKQGLAMDAEQFYDHFEASGWKMKGGQVIKDWKAAARNWARRETSFNRKQTTTAPDPKRNPIAYNLEQLRIINEKYSKPSPGDPIDEQ